MSPCIGIPNICPPLASLHQFEDGTYSLKRCLQMHITMKEMKRAHNNAVQAANNARGR